MNAAILTEDDLRLASGYRDRASLRAWMARNRIPYAKGLRGRICTTLDAYNRALGIGEPNAETEVGAREEAGTRREENSAGVKG